MGEARQEAATVFGPPGGGREVSLYGITEMLLHAGETPFFILILIVGIVLYFGKIIHKANVSTAKQFDHHLNGSLFALTYILLPLLTIIILYRALVAGRYALIVISLGVIGYYAVVTVLALTNLLKHRGAYIIDYVEEQLGDNLYPLKRLGVRHQWLRKGTSALFVISLMAMGPLYLFYLFSNPFLFGLSFVFATISMSFVAMSYSLEGREYNMIRVNLDGGRSIEGQIRDYDDEIVVVEESSEKTIRINPSYVKTVEEIPEEHYITRHHHLIDLKAFM